MIKELINKLKNSSIKEGGNNKKTIENLIVLVIILVVTIIFINYIWNGDKKEKAEQNSEKVLAEQNAINSASYSNDIEKKLEDILCKINGVGNVNVMITYASTSTVVPVYNENIQQTTTEESDTQGGTRKINENNSKKEVVYEETSGEKMLITQNTISPQIEGAIIIAKGAANATVKTNIVQAVEAVTGLPTYKIQVFEMN